MNKKEAIEKVFNSATHSKKIHEAVLFVENTKGDFSVCYGYGGRDKHTPLFTASVSKLFVTACILILQERKKLSLDDYVGEYIDRALNRKNVKGWFPKRKK